MLVYIRRSVVDVQAVHLAARLVLHPRLQRRREVPRGKVHQRYRRIVTHPLEQRPLADLLTGVGGWLLALRR